VGSVPVHLIRSRTKPRSIAEAKADPQKHYTLSLTLRKASDVRWRPSHAGSIPAAHIIRARAAAGVAAELGLPITREMPQVPSLPTRFSRELTRSPPRLALTPF
jgi:hypothetical protein